MAITLNDFLLLEDGFRLLLGDGGRLIIDETSASPYPTVNIPKENKTLNVIKQGKSIHIPERVR